MRCIAITAALFVSTLAHAAERPDILIADFEGKDYGAWKADGEAFGPGPAQGTLPGQMPVSGFEGKGLVNTFHNGDGTTGRSPRRRSAIERKYINFLIGGGGTRARRASTCWSTARSCARPPARTTAPAAASNSTGTRGTSAIWPARRP